MSRGCNCVLIGVLTAASVFAQTSTWNGGTGNWGIAGNWTGGVPGVTSTVLIDGGNATNSAVTLSSTTTIRNLTIDSGDSLLNSNAIDLTVGNGGTGASVAINGTLTLNSTGSFTDLRIADGTGFSGSGTLVLSGANARAFGVAATDTVNFSGALHLEGTGVFGVNLLKATSSGTLDIRNAATLTLNPTVFTNTGTLQASGNSTPLLAGRFDNTGGGIMQSLDTSVLKLGNGTIVAGTLLGKFDVTNSSSVSLEGAIQNQATLRLATTGAFTDFRAVDGMTLDGGGTINLDGGTARMFGVTNTSKWINLNQTYQGTGQVLLGNMDFHNQGTMNIAAGTNLNMSGGPLTNTGGIINIGAGGSADLNNVTVIDGVINGPGVVRIANSLQATFSGTVTNDAQIQLTSTGSFTDLKFTDGTTLNGSSKIILSGANARMFGTVNTNQLNLPGGLSLEGQGQFGVNALKVLNGATVDAGNGSTITMAPTLFTNNGTLQASGNSLITLSAGRFDNINGTIQALDTSSFKLSGGVTLVGGTLNANFDVINSHHAVLEGAIQNLGTLHAVSTGSFTDFRAVDGMTLDGGGTVNLDGVNARILGVTNTSKWINLDQTYQGTGQVLLGNMDFRNQGTMNIAAGTNLNTFGGALTNTGGVINIGAGGSMDINNVTLIGGTINGPGTVRLFNSLTSTLSGTIDNNTSVTVTSTGSFTNLKVANGTTLNGSGQIALSGTNARIFGVTSTDVLFNNLIITGNGQVGVNFLGIVNGGVIESSGGTLTVDPNASGIANNGVLRALLSSTLTVTDGLTNLSGGTLSGGIYDVIGTLRVAGASIATDDANITLDGPSSQFLNHTGGANALAALAAVTAAGELHIINGRAFTTTAAFTSAGTVEVGAGSSFANSGNYTQTGGVTNVNGTLDPGGSYLLQGGTLAGGGTVLANVVQSGGTLAPGNSPGTLNIAGNYTMTPLSIDTFELAGLNWDKILVSGSVTLDGTLNIVLLPGFSASNGQHFQLMQFASRTGTFAAINGLTSGQYTFTPIYNSTDFELAVSVDPTVPEPGTWTAILGGSVLLLVLRRRRA